MKRHVLVTLAAVLALGFIGSTADAQCSFEHPDKAKTLKASLVQAFVSCDGGFANTTTESGIASCAAPETFNEQAGSPADGWLWDEEWAQGLVSFSARSIVKFTQIGTTLPGANPASPLNPVGDVADLVVRMELTGIGSSSNPSGETGSGTLAAIMRATLDDRMGGDMTLIDFPAQFPFDLNAGKAKLKTSAAALLNSIGQPASTSMHEPRAPHRVRPGRERQQIRQYGRVSSAGLQFCAVPLRASEEGKGAASQADPGHGFL